MSSVSTRTNSPRHVSVRPQHIAIIMDGNGRWAERRRLPRIAGHQAGVESVRQVVRFCVEKNIRAVTLFAFSTENWQRPREEVRLLMNLFVFALEREVRKLHRYNVRLRIIGDRSAFSLRLQGLIRDSEEMTRANTGLNLVIAANYGGRWDVGQAARHLAQAVSEGRLAPALVGPDTLAPLLCLHDLPEPDLFIRTGGEKRVSNFLLWQLAYTELYFTDLLWPDFDDKALEMALIFFASRQRRFGRTGEQLAK